MLFILAAANVSKPFTDMWKKMVDIGPKWLAAIVIFAVAYVIARLAKRLVRKAVGKTSTQGHVDILIAQAVAAVIIIIGIIIALAEVGMSLTAALAAVGLASVGVGFALQDILSNLFAGIILLVQHPFTIGDQIKVGEIEGLVENVRVRDTQVLTYSGERVFIPNRTVYSNPIINYSSTPSIRVEINLGLKYAKDMDRARVVITDAAVAVTGVLENPRPVLLFVPEEEFVDAQVRFWTESERSRSTKVASDVTEKVLSALSQAGIDFMHEEPEEEPGTGLEVSPEDTQPFEPI